VRGSWVAGPRHAKVQGGTWVYRLFDDLGELLYVGVAKNLPGRLAEHLRRLHTPNWGNIEAVGFTARWYPSRALAEYAEALAIAFEAPVHNSTQAVTHASRELYASVPLGDRATRVRERIAARLGEDPGRWAHARRLSDGTDWGHLAAEIMRQSGRYCCRMELRRWADEYGPDPMPTDPRGTPLVPLSDVKPEAARLLRRTPETPKGAPLPVGAGGR
jgi:GIY-YIG catalytic domain